MEKPFVIVAYGFLIGLVLWFLIILCIVFMFGFFFTTRSFMYRSVEYVKPNTELLEKTLPLLLGWVGLACVSYVTFLPLRVENAYLKGIMLSAEGILNFMQIFFNQ